MRARYTHTASHNAAEKHFYTSTTALIDAIQASASRIPTTRLARMGQLVAPRPRPAARRAPVLAPPWECRPAYTHPAHWFSKRHE